jgi:hypothetical protein
MADLYDHKLFEITIDRIKINPHGKSDRELASELSIAAREKLLKQHPALIARIFDLKVDGLFEHIVKGIHNPLGIYFN